MRVGSWQRRFVLLGMAINAVSFGVYLIVYFALGAPDYLTVVFAPVFGYAYAPAIWLAMVLTRSDVPLLEAGAFAFILNWLYAGVAVLCWRTLTTRQVGKPESAGPA